MIFDMEMLDADKRYKFLTATVTPRPIAWITTLSASGVVNAAPFSFFNAMGHEPPTVVIGILAGGAVEGHRPEYPRHRRIRGQPRPRKRRSDEHHLYRRAARIDELTLAGLTPVASQAVRHRVLRNPRCRSNVGSSLRW